MGLLRKLRRTEQPRSRVANVDFLLLPQYYAQSGIRWNGGLDRTATQEDAGVTGATLSYDARIGYYLALDGLVGIRTEFPANVFVPQDDPKYRQTLTTGAWVRCTDTSDDHQIVGQWQATAGDSSWRIELDTTGTALNFRAQAVDDTGDVINADATGSSDLSDGDWHLVVATFDVRSTTIALQIFVDGVSEGTAAGGSTNGWNNPTTAGPVTIGVRDEADAEPFNGDLAHVFIDRRLWTPLEIRHLYYDFWTSLYGPRDVLLPVQVSAAKEASGTPNIPQPTATGVVSHILKPSGSADVPQLTASGVASMPPNITDVNGTESWTDGDTALVISGSNFT